MSHSPLLIIHTGPWRSLIRTGCAGFPLLHFTKGKRSKTAIPIYLRDFAY